MSDVLTVSYNGNDIITEDSSNSFVLPTKGKLMVDNIGITLATSSVSGGGVPSGGTTGQVLAKSSGTDYDTEWITISSGGTSVASAMLISRTQLPFSEISYSGGQLYYTVEGSGLYIDVTQDNVQQRKRIYPASVPVTITISYSTTYGSKASKQVTYEEGSSYALTASDLSGLADYNGHRFVSWDKNVGDTITANTTLTATWSDIDYSSIVLSYSSDYGTAPSSSSKTVETGASYTLTSADLPTLNDVTVNGTKYRFKDWRINGTKATTSTTISADTTLTARWVELVDIVITYSTAYGSKASRTHTVESGSSWTLVADDLTDLGDVSGHRFKGWYVSTTKQQVGQTISASTTFTASWVELITLTINYQTAYGTAPSSKTKTIESGSRYQLTYSDVTALSNTTDYNFNGWYIGNTKMINGTYLPSSSGSYTQSTSVTFVADWTESQIPLYYYGKDTPVNASDPPTPSHLTRTRTSNTTISFTTNTGAGEYTYFLTTLSLNGDTAFTNQPNASGMVWSGGFLDIGTMTSDNRTFHIWRSGYPNLTTVAYTVDTTKTSS